MKQEQNKRKKMLFFGIAFVVILALVFANKFTNKSTIQKDITQSNPLGISNDPTTQETTDEVENGKVIVSYLDESGNSIAETETYEKPIGTEYNITRKNIEHYISNGKEPVNKRGNYKEDDISVIFVYKRASDVVEVETEGNNITLKVENIIADKEYKLLLEQESTEGQKLSGGQFSMVDVKYEDQLMEGSTTNGSLVLGSVVVNNEVNEIYAISEDKAPEGYQLAMKNKRFNINLLKSYDAESKSYQLRATSGDTDYGLEEDDDNRTITVKVVNDKIKTYDLAMKMFANTIDGTSTGRNISARVNTSGEIEYDETEQNLTVLDGQRVVYTIRVYNEKNQDMAGQIVTETLPAGLKFVSDSTINTTNNWSLTNGTLTSNKLVGKTIAGIDTSTETDVHYEELQLEVEVDEELATGTTLTATSSIPVDEKEENANNNEDSETVTLEARAPVYDLAIKKYATKINNTDTGRSVTASINNLKQIQLTKTNPDNSIKNNEKIVYTFRVYNVGNQDLKGTKITDAIPAGLNFDSNSTINSQYGWTKNGNNVETTYLTSKPTIAAVKPYKGELPNYEELQVEFTLDEYSVPDNISVLENTATLETAPNETNTLNNTDTDIVSLDKIKTYDFVLKKFASKINNENTNRSVTARLTDSKTITYDENRPQKTVQDEQKIIYTIRVYNEGNQNMAGKKITDTVPTGLRLVSYTNGDNSINDTYKWRQNGDKIESTYLIGKTVQGSKPYRDELPHYEELQVEFVVVEDDTDDSVTTLTNTATIEKGDNETNESNNTDQDDITLIRRPKTYDLVIHKFASKLDNQDTGRNVTVSLNDSKEINYNIVKPNLTVTAGQKVIYTLRVFNAGNQNLQGTKITEDLPAGLKFVESETNTTYNWTVVNNKLESTYLTNKTINGCRTDKDETPNYTDVLVELEVTRDGLTREAATITNTVTLGKAQQETNITNNTDSDSISLDSLPYKDLAVRKFASKIDGTDTGKNITSRINNENMVEFVTTDVEKSVKDTQKVIYTIREFNLGKAGITCTKITEDIPSGLKYLPNSLINQQYNWQLENGILTTDYLTGTSIPALDSNTPSLQNYLDVQVEFEVVEDEADANNIIKNTVSIDKNPNDEDESNNSDFDTVTLIRKVKTYDLAIKKFAYSINGSNLEKEITASVDTNGNIIFANDNTKTSVEKSQTVVFYLRIFNLGNQPMSGKQVTDTLPEGVTFVENSSINAQYGWQANGSVITSNYLVGKTIQGFDKEQGETPTYTDLKIECKVSDETIREDKTMTNTATIEIDPLDQNPSNNTAIATLIADAEEIRVSDLALQKFLYSVDGEVLKDREIIARNINGNIVFQKNTDAYKVSNNQNLVYTLRVFNVGDGETLGRQVIEYIPKGLEFVENSKINQDNGWVMCKQDKAGNLVEVTDVTKATALKSNKLTSENILGFEVRNNEVPKYKDIQVELKVNEDNVITDDRIVTNIAKIEKSTIEPNHDNDTAEEKVKVKIFDLNITKYIKTLQVKEGDKIIQTKDIGLENKGKLYKIEIDQKKIGETQVIATYGLKIKNVGDIPGYCEELTDYFPQDMYLSSVSTTWKIDGKVAKSDEIAKRLIVPGDSATVEVTFVCDITNNNFGIKDNTAIISGYRNDYNAKDPTPDSDSEKFIISLKTGAAIGITFGIILAILILAAIGIKLKLIKLPKKNIKR